MVKNNKKIIQQVIIILLMILPLLIIISVSGAIIKHYERMVDIKFKITERPLINVPNKTEVENYFICTDLDNEEVVIGWETTGKNIFDAVTDNTFAIVENYPRLQNNGIVTKRYEIKLNDKIRAKQELKVTVGDITNHFIKQNADSQQQPITPYFQLHNTPENKSIQLFKKTNDSADPNDAASWESLNNAKEAILFEAPSVTPGKSLISTQELKSDLNKFNDFEQQYKKSNTIKLQLQFKISQEQMEADGLWDSQKQGLTDQGQIQLCAQLRLFTN
ncbi:hypothetical protein ATP_00145 [Candidatus Phytoplasma mali]|uniref:Uncharacterized protein n=1 Tax=Phytoplasma mali (strain AT) TaxID=482235 RepID=B3R0G8_PHYMT|nr:hypothetical protein [Candidatus Phytoplasma mali]CAP18332.1 hypothetical protein ATP_00145 [Candidatus Phytoplasma mali]